MNMTIHCYWCGKEITSEQAERFNNCCSERHMESQEHCSRVFIDMCNEDQTFIPCP